MADEATDLAGVDAEAFEPINRAIGSPIPPDELSAMTKIYHVELGESPWMFKVDANQAVARHPSEWSYSPWPAPKRKG